MLELLPWLARKRQPIELGVLCGHGQPVAKELGEGGVEGLLAPVVRPLLHHHELLEHAQLGHGVVHWRSGAEALTRKGCEALLLIIKRDTPRHHISISGPAYLEDERLR
jgi:hypothetical protein